MFNARVIVLAVLVAAGSAPAQSPSASASFVKRNPGTETYVPIKSATLDDNVYLAMEGEAPDGDHSLEVTIYDANGREAFRGTTTVTAKDGRWRSRVRYGFNARDPTGVWWYVAKLDDQPVASESIEIAIGSRSNNALEQTRDE